MRTISKCPEPPSLTTFRKSNQGDYDDYPDKPALRTTLVAEQGGLCCYCMGRIRDNPAAMKIEHWRSQSQHDADQLQYWNMLGACRGNMGQPPSKQHCDTRKGSRDLSWNPANPRHHVETRIGYDTDGWICSHEDTFDAELNQVLNLNLPVLRNHRRGVLDAIIEWWRAERAKRRGHVPRLTIEHERDRWADPTPELRPFCQVVVWWLELRLTKMRP